MVLDVIVGVGDAASVCQGALERRLERLVRRNAGSMPFVVIGDRHKLLKRFPVVIDVRCDGHVYCCNNDIDLYIHENRSSIIPLWVIRVVVVGQEGKT